MQQQEKINTSPKNVPSTCNYNSKSRNFAENAGQLFLMLLRITDSRFAHFCRSFSESSQKDFSEIVG